MVFMLETGVKPLQLRNGRVDRGLKYEAGVKEAYRRDVVVIHISKQGIMHNTTCINLCTTGYMHLARLLPLQ